MMSTNTHIPRDIAAKYGHQTVQIIEAGHYTSPSGQVIQIGDKIATSVAGTRSYPPEQTLPQSIRGTHHNEIVVHNETTLAAAVTLKVAGYNPVALNFASATHPGGGFLTGARAQEEYLARSSGLYACLRDNPMYLYHQTHYNPIYSNYVLYSPDVPVFRSDAGDLLKEPYTVAIITSPAAYASRVHSSERTNIASAMWERILKVLSAGLTHGHDAIVLGAWGCGAFGNDGHEIAALFRKALTENFNGAYRRVIFGIVDWSAEKTFIGPFEAAFSNLS